jgi:hypothetical protein
MTRTQGRSEVEEGDREAWVLQRSLRLQKRDLRQTSTPGVSGSQSAIVRLWITPLSYLLSCMWTHKISHLE